MIATVLVKRIETKENATTQAVFKLSPGVYYLLKSVQFLGNSPAKKFLEYIRIGETRGCNTSSY